MSQVLTRSSLLTLYNSQFQTQYFCNSAKVDNSAKKSNSNHSSDSTDESDLEEMQIDHSNKVKNLNLQAQEFNSFQDSQNNYRNAQVDTTGTCIKLTKTKKEKKKTELCQNWQQFISCPYGDKCQFAHGREELRNKPIYDARYKTRKCRDFHEKGYCSYGLRCNFIHNSCTPQIKVLPKIQVQEKQNYSEMLQYGQIDIKVRLPIFQNLVSQAENDCHLLNQ